MGWAQSGRRLDAENALTSATTLFQFAHLPLTQITPIQLQLIPLQFSFQQWLRRKQSAFSRVLRWPAEADEPRSANDGHSASFSRARCRTKQASNMGREKSA